MSLTKSRPTIHFAHANGFPASTYKRMFSHLNHDFAILAVEKFAHNPRFPVSLGWRNQVDELMHLIDKEHGDEPVYAVGHSFGAVVSYLAACLYPHRFRGLIMLDPPLITGITGWLVRALRPTPLYDKFTPAKKAETRCTRWNENENVVDYFAKKALFSQMHIQCIEDYVEAAVKRQDGQQLLHFDNQVEADIFRTIPLDIHKMYGKLSIPALLLTGENTQVCKEKLIRPFIRGNQIEHQVVPKGGHMFPLEQPDYVGKLIHSQLSKWQAQYAK